MPRQVSNQPDLFSAQGFRRKKKQKNKKTTREAGVRQLEGGAVMPHFLGGTASALAGQVLGALYFLAIFTK